MESASETENAMTRPKVSFRESFWTWCRVAALSFGGPAGQIATMHRIIVDEKKWIGEERFLHALNYCMLLPGPEAQQLATYIGWLMHRTPGALMAGGLFILPGFVSILALSILYTYNEQSSVIQAIFFGLKPAVIAIVIEAVIRIGKRVLKNGAMLSIAAATFVAIYVFGVSFPILIIAAGIIGFAGSLIAPAQFYVIKGHGTTAKTDAAQQSTESFIEQDSTPPSFVRSLRISVVCLLLWLGPLGVIWSTLGPTSVYFKEGTFFSEAAVVTFGGAYSVLGYVAQEAVENQGWLQPGEMLDGLGMAETTPGPLIMVVQFVGFMGAYRNPGPFTPIVGGILGSLVTTWVTFVPCFFWILLGAPYVERLRSHQRISSALSAITASVVGVVLNLAVWFSLHTLFAKVQTVSIGGMHLQVPEIRAMNIGATIIAVLACLLTFYWKKGLAITLGISVLAGAAWSLAMSR